MSPFFDGSLEPGIHEGFEFPNLWLFPLEDTYWAGAGGPDGPGSQLVKGLQDDESAWAESGFYVFGQTDGGVSVCYCESPPGGGSGKIVLAGSWGSLGPPDHPEVLVLGTSLAEWLSRWMAHDFMELAYVPGELPAASEAAGS